MKKALFSICVFFPLWLQAQVPKMILAEHFTNTLCGICASKNPGLLSNAFSEPGLMHLSIHPSSPYSACVFSQHNMVDNNTRASYYGVFGSTPRLVINGDVLPVSANYANTSIYGPYRAQTTPAEVRITAERTPSTYTVQIVIKTASSHTLPALRLFAGVAEDTINYAAPNGEGRHYDVFRDWFTVLTGEPITLPAAVGDSIVFTQSISINPEWNLTHLYPFAILQEEISKDLVQANKTKATEIAVLSGLQTPQSLSATAFPNPAGSMINLQWESSEPAFVQIIDAQGQVIKSKTLDAPGNISLPENTSKLLFVSLQVQDSKKVFRIIRE